MTELSDYTKQALQPPTSARPPRLLVIGAGSRGNAYARAISQSSNGQVAAVAEPVRFKRQQLGRKYIWGQRQPEEGEEFEDWRAFLTWELDRRSRAAKGESVAEAIDGLLVCTLDESHAEIITQLAQLELHMMSEKPLATTLDDCLSIYRSLAPRQGSRRRRIFAIGHVLRYSPHNMLLRRLLLSDEVIGEVISVEHTEPVGWWHFAHSYVRGNWRQESKTAPSLLTKSCHDIDLLLWLLTSPSPLQAAEQPHLPSTVTSTGSLKHYKRSKKPAMAGTATNCLKCPAEGQCIYSARKIYVDRLSADPAGFPVRVVVPEVEDLLRERGMPAVERVLLERLAEDYDADTPEVDARPWYGRCVYEAGNDVCDDQYVTLTWDEEADGTGAGRGAKTASFHMVAFTKEVCQRRSRIYGSRGEIEADSSLIKVHDFESGHTTTHRPHLPGGGHGGGDDGLARQFVLAVDAVKNQGMEVAEAQQQHLGCTLEDVIRSHAMVFAAEEARREQKIVDWKAWWRREVEARLDDVR